jgi:hypothetical protein
VKGDGEGMGGGFLLSWGVYLNTEGHGGFTEGHGGGVIGG